MGLDVNYTQLQIVCFFLRASKWISFFRYRFYAQIEFVIFLQMPRAQHTSPCLLWVINTQRQKWNKIQIDAESNTFYCCRCIRRSAKEVKRVSFTAIIKVYWFYWHTTFLPHRVQTDKSLISLPSRQMKLINYLLMSAFALNLFHKQCRTMNTCIANRVHRNISNRNRKFESDIFECFSNSNQLFSIAADISIWPFFAR